MITLIRGIHMPDKTSYIGTVYSSYSNTELLRYFSYEQKVTHQYQIKSSSLTLFLAHPLLSPFPSLSSPGLCTCQSFPRNPLEPASGSAPSAPAGFPTPPSPSWNHVCGSPTPVRAGKTSTPRSQCLDTAR